MKSIKLKADIASKSSRKELLVRLVYWIPLLIVFYVLNLVSAVCWVVNLFSVIIRGRVSVSLGQVQRTAINYMYKMQVYYSFLTDERPPILPEKE